MDISRLTVDREQEILGQAKIFGRVDTRADVTNVAAQAGKVLTQDDALTARGADSVTIVVDQRIADRRTQRRSKLVTQITACTQGITFDLAVTIEVAEEGILVERQDRLFQLIARAQTDIFGDRKTKPNRAAGAGLRVSRVAPVSGVAEAVVILAIQVSAEQDVLVEQIRFDESELGRPRVARPIDPGVHFLALAEEITLGDVGRDDELLKAGIARRQLQLAGRLFFDIEAQDHPVGCRTLGLFDFQLLLEEAERLDPVLRALDLERVEGVTFVDPEFAADDLVAGDRVAVDVDPLDVDAWRFVDPELDVHQLLFGIAIIGRIDVGEGIALGASHFAQAGDDILDQLGIEPVARLDADQRLELFRGQIAKRAFGTDRAEFVARAFLDHIGDDEVAAIGRQLGQRRNDAEIGITLGEIESAQLLLVRGEAIRIVAVIGLEHPEQAAGFLGVHFLAQPAIAILVIADDVDCADLRGRALVDLKHQIDAVLIELDDLRFDRRCETAAALV